MFFLCFFTQEIDSATDSATATPGQSKNGAAVAVVPVPAARRKPVKVPSYDDRMNPFMEEFHE